MHLGAISKKLSFMIIFHAHAFDGSIDTKTVLRTILTVVALNPTHNLIVDAESNIAWFLLDLQPV